jgi:hypothetical protein
MLETHVVINAIPAPNAPLTKFKALFQRLFKTLQFAVIASHRVGAKRRPMTGSAKQSTNRARR